MAGGNIVADAILSAHLDMGLSAGSRIGPYEVVGAIGAGGMGQVYRARDTKLGRDVALKVLPDEFAHDADRLARFEREAYVLASLNHPHIAIIHGFEEADGGAIRAIVMELVPGQTLAERLTTGKPLDLAEALPIARQIAAALEAAHERGIVHRDLKPANIKVRDDGVVKVLDFGLAKETATVATGDIANTPTRKASAHTARGELLGTAAYMSPEQARGKPVDKRADIWAFGVVLHEMLTGRRLFTGESATDLLAQVLTRELDPAELPRDLPAPIRTLLDRCLTRDPNTRLRDIGEARIAIDEHLAHPNRAAPDAGAIASPLWKRAWPIAAAGAAGIALGIAIALMLRASPAAKTSPATLRTSIQLPAGQTLTPPQTGTLALSPDGQWLAYKASVGGTARLFVRDMIRGGEPREVPDTDSVESFTFAPDGQSVAFSAKNTVKRVPLIGGAALQLCGCTVRTNMYWAPDGFVYFAGWTDKKYTLRRMPAAGGGPKAVEMPADLGNKHVTHPAPLPGGRRLLVVVSEAGTGELISPSIAAYDLDTFAVTPLVSSGTMPRYLPTGYLMFARGSTVFAVRFDAATLKIVGDPAPMVEDVGIYGWYAQADYAVADEGGTLVYGAVPFTRSRVVRFTADLPPEPLVPDAQGFIDLAVSSTGQRLAITIDKRGIPRMAGVPYKADLYIRSLPSGDLTQRATGEIRAPIFLPDGRTLAFSRRTGADWTIDVGESKFEKVLSLTDKTYTGRPWSVTADGKRLAYDHNGNLYVLPLDAGTTPKEFLKSRQSQTYPAFSPDGRWIAYALNDGTANATDDVWVRPYPGPDPAVRVSTDGGSMPRWSSDGKRIFFVGRDGSIVSVDVIPGALFRSSALRRLTKPLEGVRAFAVAPDGLTFYAIVDEFPGPAPKREITVVTGWFDEVRRLMNGSR